MRTAIDTNVLSALWSKESVASDIARNLGNAKTEGGLVVGASVYAELLAYFAAAEHSLQNAGQPPAIKIVETRNRRQFLYPRENR